MEGGICEKCGYEWHVSGEVCECSNLTWICRSILAGSTKTSALSNSRLRDLRHFLGMSRNEGSKKKLKRGIKKKIISMWGE